MNGFSTTAAVAAVAAVALSGTNVDGAALSKNKQYTVPTHSQNKYEIMGEFMVNSQGPFNLEIDSGSSNMGIRAFPFNVTDCESPYLEMECDGTTVKSTYAQGASLIGTGCKGSMKILGDSNYDSLSNDNAEFFKIEQIEPDESSCGAHGIIGFGMGKNAAYGSNRTGLDFLLDGVQDRVWASELCASDYLINVNDTRYPNEYIYELKGSLDFGGYDESKTKKDDEMKWVPLEKEYSLETGFYCTMMESLTLRWNFKNANSTEKSPGEIKFDGKLIDGTNPRMNEQCNAIVDTGNSNALGLPQFLHDLVVQNMYLYQKYVKNPACVTSADFKLFPDIVIRFTNDQEISIAPKDYAMFGLSNPNNTGEITPDNLCWSMHSGINVLPSNTNIGVAFLQKYYTVFDIDQSRIGFKASACHA